VRLLVQQQVVVSAPMPSWLVSQATWLKAFFENSFYLRYKKIWLMISSSIRISIVMTIFFF
jgi:hypothetical protein